VQARFVQELMPGGTFEDRTNEDPDFLTILNQPFAIELDPATLRDLRDLRGSVPFSAASPLGGDAVLRGFLRPGAPGEIGGRKAIGVRFEAEGVMTGPLPDHSASVMSGQIRMDGTAYYATGDALLLALDATLTIMAQLHEDDSPAAVPVHIVYRRVIRASAEELKTLPPTPLASGAGTDSPGGP
jgi:hypothetical protein